MKKITILNGDIESEDNGFSEYMERLADRLNQSNLCSIFPLSQMNLHHCTGCFSCWWKTPGKCVIKDDAEDIFKAVIRSDLVIFASPLVGGFTSSVLKMIMDRMIVLIHPYIILSHGECHHAKRYDKYPNLGLLIQKEVKTDEEDLKIVEDIYDRFAINFHREMDFVELVGNWKLEDICEKIEIGSITLENRKRLLTNDSSLSQYPSFHLDKSVANVQFQSSNNKLAVFNGSPRFKNSNSKALITEFLKGYHRIIKDEVPVYYLASTKDRRENINAFKNADVIILFFPLYTDCMPGIVKEFFEDVMCLSNLSEKKLGFVVQSGFPETIHLFAIEKYLEKFVKHLSCEYLGTVVKGGVESIRFQRKKRTDKLFFKFNDLGEYYAFTGSFSSEIINSFHKFFKIPPFFQFIFGLVIKLGMLNSYWNTNMKKNGVYDRRFDKPYE